MPDYRVEPGKILEQLAEGKVVIVTGFQGITEDGQITTLGRGGSDTTASALGVALDAEAEKHRYLYRCRGNYDCRSSDC